MTRDGIVFLDANILIHADRYDSDNVFVWLEQVYDDIYIHNEVFKEIQNKELKLFVQSKFDDKSWTLFDQTDEALLSEEEYDEFETYVTIVRDAFRKVHRWKEQQGIPVKDKKNTGELYSLAAALLLNARYICSNDFEISQVIEKGDLRVMISEEEDELIVHDTLLDFCSLAYASGIPRKKVKAFLRRSDLKRIDDFDRRHPVD